jgi:cell division septation protein DedD
VANKVQDDAFHEIQLNGKQLVFLFMAATVLSVGIFLSGVYVGRGVRAVRLVDASSLTTVAEAMPQQPAPAPPPAGSDPRAAAPPPAVDDLSYFNRLEKPSAATEKLKPATDAAPVAAPPPAPPAKPAKEPALPAPPAKPAKEPARPPAATAVNATPPPSEAPGPSAEPALAAEPAGQGFAVQIAALNIRSEADAIVKRLSSKGYAAYVISPANGTPAVYRVRVGKFPTRREAETIAAKLQKEEQFKPWVTR